MCQPGKYHVLYKFMFIKRWGLPSQQRIRMLRNICYQIQIKRILLYLTYIFIMSYLNVVHSTKHAQQHVSQFYIKIFQQNINYRNLH